MHIDQLGNKINLKELPKRIISLVPSQTELLYHLGLGDKVVGITKFCIHPNEWFKSKTRVGGPKMVDVDKIKALNPDLIIANKEENIKEQIEALQEIAPVWLSDIFNLEDSLDMISKVGALCGAQDKADEINQQIKYNFSDLKPLTNQVSVLYMIWKEPFMAVGSNTFIHEMLTAHLGFENIIGDQERYPILDNDNLPNPDYVFLSTEPYPFKEKHIAEVQPYFPNSKIMVVDGEPFTWYGSRLIDSPSYFKKVLKNL